MLSLCRVDVQIRVHCLVSPCSFDNLGRRHTSIFSILTRTIMRDMEYHTGAAASKAGVGQTENCRASVPYRG